MTAASPSPMVDSFSAALRSGYKIMVLRGSSSENWLSSAPPGTGEAEVYKR